LLSGEISLKKIYFDKNILEKIKNRKISKFIKKKNLLLKYKKTIIINSDSGSIKLYKSNLKNRKATVKKLFKKKSSKKDFKIIKFSISLCKKLF
jgi:DNA polymerase II small subunit/DNA polymerase delta subunit B